MSSKVYVLDASALLCLLNDEPGAEAVASAMSGGVISAVNLVEVISKLTDKGLDGQSAITDLSELGLEVVDFDRRQAELAGLLRVRPIAMGLSLGDRACLALAMERGAVALTGDRAWATLDIGVEVQLIR